MPLYKRLLPFISLCLIVVSFSVHADKLDQADAAVAEILFEYDGSQEFASYRVSESGDVDILFAVNMPDDLYAEIITKLNEHKDISSVLAGKGGPACRF